MGKSCAIKVLKENENNYNDKVSSNRQTMSCNDISLTLSVLQN